MDIAIKQDFLSKKAKQYKTLDIAKTQDLLNKSKGTHGQTLGLSNLEM